MSVVGMFMTKVSVAGQLMIKTPVLNVPHGQNVLGRNVYGQYIRGRNVHGQNVLGRNGYGQYIRGRNVHGLNVRDRNAYGNIMSVACMFMAKISRKCMFMALPQSS